ncbi:MAG: Na+/H+ antiporter NhaA, partial [Candidatus Krumholzibacteriia bacterium]
MARNDHDDLLPRQPIHRVVDPVARFLHVEAASGVLLLACTAVALVLANSAAADWYAALWKTPIGFSFGDFSMIHSLKHWINDGLMAIFFFVVGLEVKREMVLGELRDPRRAALPVAAAIGGMIVPAGIYLLLIGGGEAARGWGIPMATDIAFVVGCLAVLGPRVPRILRVLLLTLAIVDDIGAILVIAIGYTESLDLAMLGLAFAGLALVWILGRLGARSFSVYVMVGAVVWFGFHESGVHATIAGVLLGLLTPASTYLPTNVIGNLLRRADETLHGGEWGHMPHRADTVHGLSCAVRESISPLEYLEARLHPWSSFVIMPVFALANAGVAFSLGDFADPVAVAVMAGLVVGKPVGILLLSFLAVRLVTRGLPEGLTWPALAGGSFLAGIGFTMALFIAGLALDGATLDAAKVGVLGASALAAVLGMGLLVAVL